MKTKSVVCWTARDEIKRFGKLGSFGDVIGLQDLWRRRGKKEEWLESDWPPVRVRITVEILDEA